MKGIRFILNVFSRNGYTINRNKTHAKHKKHSQLYCYHSPVFHLNPSYIIFSWCFYLNDLKSIFISPFAHSIQNWNILHFNVSTCYKSNSGYNYSISIWKGQFGGINACVLVLNPRQVWLFRLFLIVFFYPLLMLNILLKFTFFYLQSLNHVL